MWKGAKPTTAICTSTTDSITVRGHDLVEDLVGQTSFTEMMFLCVMGRRPTTAETAIVDAVMVILMEHGLTPSALATRLVYASSPEAMQAGVAAGLLAVGNNFVGTMEGAALLLEEMVADEAGIEAAARRLAEAYRAAKKNRCPASATPSTGPTIRARRNFWPWPGATACRASTSPRFGA